MNHAQGLLEATRQELETNPLFKTPTSTTLEKLYLMLETLKAETLPLATKIVKEEPKKEQDATMDDGSAQ